MNRLCTANRSIMCIALFLLNTRSVVAQDDLLAEFRTQGFCYDCPPTQIEYQFSFTNQQSPAPIGSRAEWAIMAGVPEVGQAFVIHPDLVPFFNNVLGYPGPVLGRMICCNGDVGEIYNIVDDDMGPVFIDRIAPILGPNLFGYHITNLTMTVDQLNWVPIASNRFRGETNYTARIYGVPIPPLLGDFNVDGTVTAADYVTWRDRVAENDLMPNGVGTGLFQGRAVAGDYGLWRARFGSSAFSSNGLQLAGIVPEPNSILLSGLSAFIYTAFWLRICRPRR